MSGSDDVSLASGAKEAAVTLTALSPRELQPVLQALARALPNLARGDAVPPFGQIFINSDGFVVMSTVG